MVPILLIIFNKPEKTRLVLKAINQVKPSDLYVLCDGPREWVDGEAELTGKSKKLIEELSWDCAIHRNYFSVNVGIIETFSRGLNWFFEKNESGIILESDCLPGTDFFFFCDKLLHYYKDNDRIWHISGDNHQRGQWRGDGSYYFSSIPHIWGWATWRRAWQNYDPYMKDLPEIIDTETFKSRFDSPEQYKVWSDIFRKTYYGQINTWDYQWTYSIMKSNALAIVPNVNLVSNIGFGKDALHTKDRYSPFSLMPIAPIHMLSHPSAIERSPKADAYTFYHNIAGRRTCKSIGIKILDYFLYRFIHTYRKLSKKISFS